MMAKAYGKEIARYFARNVKPGYDRIRARDSDAWLAAMGLERRSVPADVMGAIGLLLAGASIGLAAGLLLAPRQGVETRRQVMDKLRSVRQAASQKADEMRQASEHAPYGGHVNA